MTGKQIADNLAGSSERWGRHTLYESSDRSFCALGLKAYEAGIAIEDLENGMSDFLDFSAFDIDSIVNLTTLNDNSPTKESLIAALRSDKFADKIFDVEGFIAAYKARIIKRDAYNKSIEFLHQMVTRRQHDGSTDSK